MPSFKNSRESSGTPVALALALAAVVVHEEAESPCDGSAAHCRMLVWKNHAPVRRAHSLALVAEIEEGSRVGLHDFLGSRGDWSPLDAVSALASPRACVFFLKKIDGI
jgi:hypothetical protein